MLIRFRLLTVSYLITISREDGKIRWHSGPLAGQFVDTKPKTYKDGGEGRGIMRLEVSNVPDLPIGSHLPPSDDRDI